MESGLRVMNKATALTTLAQFKEGGNASHAAARRASLGRHPPSDANDRPYRRLGWGFGLNFKNRTQLKMG